MKFSLSQVGQIRKPVLSFNVTLSSFTCLLSKSMICWLLFPVRRASKVAPFKFRQLGKIRKDDAESITQGGTVVVVVVVDVVVVVVVVEANLLVSLAVESVLLEECSSWVVCWTIHTPRKMARARKTVKAEAIMLHRFHEEQTLPI